jgi:hypothetical protein
MVASRLEPSHGNCEERDRLRDEYRAAVSLWMNAGGTDPQLMDRPLAQTAKKDLDHVAKLLIDHRQHHGC